MSKTKLRVNEIFFSIQGESSRAGWPCIFIRLTGCNLRCCYCDTSYAYDESHEMTISAIIDEVRKLCHSSNDPLVEITGGEPLLQQGGVTELVKALKADGYHKRKMGPRILIETNGTIPLVETLKDKDWRRGLVSIIADIKTPGCKYWLDAKSVAGLQGIHIVRDLTIEDEVKFVITSEADYEWAKQICERLGLVGKKLRKVKMVHFSAAVGMLDTQTLAEWVLRDRYPVHFQLQQHKIIWPDVEKGR